MILCVLLTGDSVPVIVADELYGAVHHGQAHIEAWPVLLSQAEGGHREEVNQTLPGGRNVTSERKYWANRQ